MRFDGEYRRQTRLVQKAANGLLDLLPALFQRVCMVDMKTLLGLFTGLALAASAFAHDITLTWNPSTDVTVSGYKIYYSQVGQALTNVWRVGNTNLTTITNLVSATNIIYRFTCVATNAAGLESVPTMELQSVIPPHAVKKPRFVAITSSSVMLTWQASDEADAKTYKVTYGTINPWTSNSVTVAHPVTSLTITNGLVPNVEHYFDFTVINNPGVESWPKYQLRNKLVPAGPSDLKVGVIVN